MKTVKILGLGNIEVEKNGVSRTEYFESLRKVAQWHGISPYNVDLAIIDRAKGLQQTE